MTADQFPTKTAIVLERGLLAWQELNVAAFLASAVASKYPETMGPDFVDASKVRYAAIFRQPVLIFQGDINKLRKTYRLARERNLIVGIYTRPIFATQGDDNVKAISAVAEDAQDLVGIVIYGKTELVNQCTKHISLHP